MKRLALFALPLLLLALTCRAADDDACRVARIFSDNMVLQQGKPVPIWGWAAPGDSVHVVFRGKQYGATADGLGTMPDLALTVTEQLMLLPAL